MNAMNKQMKLLVSVAVILSLLSGCAAISTSIAKKDLNVQTKMSDSIFLDPVEPDKRVIYLQVRNTSDKSNFDIQSSIAASLQSKGYIVTNNPKTAYYWLHANVLSVDQASPTAAQAALGTGYGGALAGAALGGTIGAAAGGWAGAGYGGMAGGLAGALVETVANSAVKDVTFMAITDIEIAEKTADGEIVRQDSQQDAKQGIGGSRRQTSSKVTNMKKYRTRVVSTANKVNLEYEEAASLLTSGLTHSISGIF
jgi:outer membrane lipoprotein SlyB